MLLMSATGEAPTPSTASDQLCDDAHRIAALRECFANDLALTRLGTISNLRSTALQLRVTLQMSLDEAGEHPPTFSGQAGFLQKVFRDLRRVLFVDDDLLHHFGQLVGGQLGRDGVEGDLQLWRRRLPGHQRHDLV